MSFILSLSDVTCHYHCHSLHHDTSCPTDLPFLCLCLCLIACLHSASSSSSSAIMCSCLSLYPTFSFQDRQIFIEIETVVFHALEPAPSMHMRDTTAPTATFSFSLLYDYGQLGLARTAFICSTRVLSCSVSLEVRPPVGAPNNSALASPTMPLDAALCQRPATLSLSPLSPCLFVSCGAGRGGGGAEERVAAAVAGCLQCLPPNFDIEAVQEKWVASFRP